MREKKDGNKNKNKINKNAHHQTRVRRKVRKEKGRIFPNWAYHSRQNTNKITMKQKKKENK